MYIYCIPERHDQKRYRLFVEARRVRAKKLLPLVKDDISGRTCIRRRDVLKRREPPKKFVGSSHCRLRRRRDASSQEGNGDVLERTFRRESLHRLLSLTILSWWNMKRLERLRTRYDTVSMVVMMMRRERWRYCLFKEIDDAEPICLRLTELDLTNWPF